jgi:hypothetical protein
MSTIAVTENYANTRAEGFRREVPMAAVGEDRDCRRTGGEGHPLSYSGWSRKTFDNADEFFLPIALPTGKSEQFTATHDHLAQTRSLTDDRDPPSTAKFQDSLIPQLPQGSEHRVLVHAHYGCKVTSWWQSFSRFDFSFRYFSP